MRFEKKLSSELERGLTISAAANQPGSPDAHPSPRAAMGTGAAGAAAPARSMRARTARSRSSASFASFSRSFCSRTTCTGVGRGF